MNFVKFKQPGFEKRYSAFQISNFNASELEEKMI